MRNFISGFICGILFWKWYANYKNNNQNVKINKCIPSFTNLFGSEFYKPCKCGFPKQVCTECNSLLNVEFPSNILLFSKSSEYKLPIDGISLNFYKPLSINTIDEILLHIEIPQPIQFGNIMIHYPNQYDKQTELLWCASTSNEAKNIFPIREILSRIVQICDCSIALGYTHQPITSIIIHDIDVFIL